MNACYLSSRNQQLCRASYVTTSYNSISTFLVGCEKSRFHVVEVFVFFGFCLCFLADAIYADRTLCKYLWVTGLLDFHITDKSFYYRKLQWTLRFPMPRPAAHSGERHFSSATTSRQGPHSAEAMEEALRLAAPFFYAQDATHILYNSPFLRLPHISAIIDPSRLPPLDTPHPPEPCIQEWLNNGAPQLLPSRLRSLITPVPSSCRLFPQ